MTRITLTKAQAIAAENAIAPTRHWWDAKAETGTQFYAVNPDAWPKDENGEDVTTIEFPILDESVEAILQGLFPELFPKA
jgi:hypothetical protein